MRKVFLFMVFVSLLVSSLIFANQPKAVLRELSNVGLMTSSFDGQYLLAAGEDGSFIFMDLRKNVPPKRVFVSNVPLKGLAISEDKSYFACVTEDGLIKVYDLVTQQEVRSYVNTGKDAKAIALRSTATKLVAVLYGNGDVRVYNFLSSTSKPVREFNVGEGKGIYFVKDDTLLVVADNSISSYELDGSLKRTLRIDNITAYTPVFGTRMFLLGDSAGNVYLVDSEKLEQLSSWKVLDREISVLSVSPNPKAERLVVVANESSFPVFCKISLNSPFTLETIGYSIKDREDEKKIRALLSPGILSAFVDPLYDVVRSGKISIDRIGKSFFYFGTRENIVRLELEPYKRDEFIIIYLVPKDEIIDFKGHTGPVNYIKVSADRYMLTLDGATMRIWDLANLSSIEIKLPYEDPSDVKDFMPSFGKYLILTDGEEVRTLSVSSFENLINKKDEFKIQQRFYVSQYTNDDSKVVKVDFFRVKERDQYSYYTLAVLDNGKIITQSLETGQIKILGDLSTRILDMKLFSDINDIPYVVFVSEDGKARLWKLKGDELLAEFNVGVLEPSADIIAVNASKSLIAFATKNNIKVYRFSDLSQGKTRPAYTLDEVKVSSIAFSGDAKLIIGTQDGRLVVYDALNRTRTQTIEVSPVSAILKVAATEKYIIVSDEHGNIKIW